MNTPQKVSNTAVVQINDLVFLYHPTTGNWIGRPNVVRKDTGHGLKAVPTVTKDAQNAEMMLLENMYAASKRLAENMPFRVRTLANVTGSAIYLAPAPTGGVEFIEATDVGLISWRARQSGSSVPVLYGIEYVLTNDGLAESLHPDAKSQDRLSTSKNGSGGWIFVPTRALYICDAAVNQCITSQQTDNTTVGLKCTTDNTNGEFSCTDRYGRPVFFEHRECVAKCGRTN